MTNTMKKALSIILAAAMIFTMSASFNFGKAYAEITYNYTYDLGKGVTIYTDKDLDNGLSTTGSQVVINVKIQASENLYSAEVKEDYSNQWDFAGDNSPTAEITIKTSICGKQTLVIDTNSAQVKREYYVRPMAPNKVKFVTNPYGVFFITIGQNPDTYGDSTYVDFGNGEHVLAKNHQKMGDVDQTSYTLNPNTTYNLTMWGYDSKTDTRSATSVSKTIKTGPATSPVIKKITASKVKITKDGKDWDSIQGKYVQAYKNTWTFTITLSKKPSGIKGIEFYYGSDHYPIAKGNKTTYKIKVTRRTTGFNYKKAQTMPCYVRTFSNNDYMAYSLWSKCKNVKVKG